MKGNVGMRMLRKHIWFGILPGLLLFLVSTGWAAPSVTSYYPAKGYSLHSSNHYRLCFPPARGRWPRPVPWNNASVLT